MELILKPLYTKKYFTVQLLLISCVFVKIKLSLNTLLWFSTLMEPSVNILQVAPFIINSKQTNAWCLSDDLMYTCKLSQDSGVTKPNAGGEIVQEPASTCYWKSWLLLSLLAWPSYLDSSRWAQAQARGLPQSPWRLQLSLSSPCSIHWAIVLAQVHRIQLWWLLLPVTAEILQHKDHRRQFSSNLYSL